ncbi:Glycosyltransferase-like 1B, partial [Rhizopus stolonifer]
KISQLILQLGINRKRALQAVLALVTLISFKILFPLSRTKGALKNQPIYERQAKNCSAVLCNPFKKCSTWFSDQHYDWSELSQAGIFRDLATVQVDLGCELAIKVQGSDWITLSAGITNCLRYDTQCRDLVELKLKDSILVLASHLKDKMKERSNDGKEIILVHNEKSVNNNMDVTLVSQFSIHRLEAFSQVIELWQGPISIAIYLTEPTDIDKLIEFFKIPKNLKLYSRLTITLVKPNYNHVNHLNYPINHLRNLAITESFTDYIFVTDAVPSSHMYTLIQSRLIPHVTYSPEKKTAWIIPCFAIHEAYAQLPIPDTYHEWFGLINQGVAYMAEQGPGLVQPLLLETSLAYEVCYESQWEPYYIVHRSAPLYDIRFRNQGGDKQSHALQLNAERFRFKVFSQVFTIHRDSPNQPRNGGKPKGVKSWSHLDEFMQEMESIYGMNPKWPRGCSAMAIGWQDQKRNVLGLAAGAA